MKPVIFLMAIVLASAANAQSSASRPPPSGELIEAFINCQPHRIPGGFGPGWEACAKVYQLIEQTSASKSQAEEDAEQQQKIRDFVAKQ